MTGFGFSTTPLPDSGLLLRELQERNQIFGIIDTADVNLIDQSGIDNHPEMVNHCFKLLGFIRYVLVK